MAQAEEEQPVTDGGPSDENTPHKNGSWALETQDMCIGHLSATYSIQDYVCQFLLTVTKCLRHLNNAIKVYFDS